MEFTDRRGRAFTIEWYTLGASCTRSKQKNAEEVEKDREVVEDTES